MTFGAVNGAFTVNSDSWQLPLYPAAPRAEKSQSLQLEGQPLAPALSRLNRKDSVQENIWEGKRALPTFLFLVLNILGAKDVARAALLC